MSEIDNYIDLCESYIEKLQNNFSSFSKINLDITQNQLIATRIIFREIIMNQSENISVVEQKIESQFKSIESEISIIKDILEFLRSSEIKQGGNIAESSDVESNIDDFAQITIDNDAFDKIMDIGNLIAFSEKTEEFLDKLYSLQLKRNALLAKKELFSFNTDEVSDSANLLSTLNKELADITYDINFYISGVEETKRVGDSISILGRTEFINVNKINQVKMPIVITIIASTLLSFAIFSAWLK